jgi:hypothetical protein
MLHLCCSRPPTAACVHASTLLFAGEGSYVTLVPGFKACSDAARGPLSLMRTEDAYGLVLMESGQRYRVSAATAAAAAAAVLCWYPCWCCWWWWCACCELFCVWFLHVTAWC